jgi:glycosidase
LKFYAAMNSLRRQHPALQQGQLIWINNSDEQHILTYLRRSEGEEFLIAVNLSSTSFRGAIEAAGGNWDEIKLPGFDLGPAALPALSLESFGVRVFHRPLHPNDPGQSRGF